MTNVYGWDSVCCCEAELNYDELRNSTPAQRNAYYMDWYTQYQKPTTCIYPWRRSTTVIPQDFDMCSSPNGIPNANTKIGIRLYRSPTNDLPLACRLKCADCRNNGRNCGTCQGQ